MSAMHGHLSDELLSAQLDGVLDATEASALSEHLATCADCSRRLELVAATARAVGGLPEEALPRPLDLGFLSASAPIVLAERRPGWRPPAWAAPVLAAAAVLVLAVGVGPRVLGGLHTGGGSTASGLSQKSTTAGNAAPAVGAAPFFAPAASPAVNRGADQAGSAAAPAANPTLARGAVDAVQLELTSSSQAASAGQPVSLALKATASRPVSVASMRLVVRRGSSSEMVAQTTGRSLNPGESASVTATWTAGQVSGPAQPGDVVVEGHVILSDGRDVNVNLTIHVT